MSRRRRYHDVDEEDDDEFETPALRDADRAPQDQQVASDDSEEELQSESGLGESPEEDLMEEAAQQDDDDDDDDEKEDDSDDDAPEDVDFKTGREVEQKRMQSILDEIRKGREETKDRRRKKDKLFKLQKQEKLAELNKRKLPEELLDALAQSPEKKQKKPANTGKTGKTEKEEEGAEGGDDGEKEDAEEEDIDFSESDDEDRLHAAEDFIPLSSDQEEGTQVEVVSLEAQKRKGCAVTQSAADFKRSMLFGGRHKRVTNKQARLTQAKRKARH